MEKCVKVIVGLTMLGLVIYLSWQATQRIREFIREG